jgi:hypothetical protein
MAVKERTKREYQNEWDRYRNWCKDKIPILSSNAEAYLKETFNKKPSMTIKKKRNQLQTIIRSMTKHTIEANQNNKEKRKILFNQASIRYLPPESRIN